MNLTLLTKWWWRFFNEPSTPWNKLIRSLYYTRRTPLHEGRSFLPHSQWWRSVLFCQDIFKCGTIYKIGDGRDIRLWSDIWLGETSLRTQFPEIYDNVRNKDVSVSHCWNTNGWGWRFICRGFAANHTADVRK
uniref:Reverse transcriptase zinc-binding domain-containing protein n=1 Tax=Ananas comosus var. bracteatus TaxID=296719 RepID=A0A6V7PGN4_ANACO|nr:unnamed protein product [Ananas comosus var. bracteatus]